MKIVVIGAGKVGSTLASQLVKEGQTSADINCFCSSVDVSLYFSDVGLPHSVGRAMRMGNLSAENNAFSANAALCHVKGPPCIYIECTY